MSGAAAHGAGAATPRALLLIGAVGVGKTTTTDAIAEELEARSIPGSAFDLDWLRRAWPAPSDDRFGPHSAPWARCTGRPGPRCWSPPG